MYVLKIQFGRYKFQSKTEKGVRNIPVIPQLAGMLGVLELQRNQCQYIFNLNGEKLTNGHIRYICSKAADLAGIRHVTPHMLRHTFASRLFEVGADTKSISEILGHTNVAFTLQTYVTVGEEHLAQQMEKLSQRY